MNKLAIIGSVWLVLHTLVWPSKPKLCRVYTIIWGHFVMYFNIEIFDDKYSFVISYLLSSFRTSTFLFLFFRPGLYKVKLQPIN